MGGATAVRQPKDAIQKNEQQPHGTGGLMKRSEWEELNGYGKYCNPSRCCLTCKYSTVRLRIKRMIGKRIVKRLVKCLLLKKATKASTVNGSNVCSNFERRAK